MTKPANSAPTADTAAMLAASCVARIFQDFLMRSNVRFLPAISCWYVCIALLALVHARGLGYLGHAADEPIETLRLSLRELGAVFPHLQGTIHKLNGLAERVPPSENDGSTPVRTQLRDPLDPNNSRQSLEHERINWAEYFPFMTGETTSMARLILNREVDESLFDFDYTVDGALQLDELFNFMDLPTTQFATF